MLKHLVFMRSRWVMLALALLAAGLGCTGFSLTDKGVGVIINEAVNSTLIVRVINGTTANVQTTIRVDGEIKELPICSVTQRTCDYLLAYCPATVELISEARYDAADLYVGGRNFEGSEGYTFTNGEFSCGGQVIYEFNEKAATALAF